MEDIYRSLGVRRVVNAAGTLTRLGGPPMAAEAVEAMREASRWSVSIEELTDRAVRLYSGALRGTETRRLWNARATGISSTPGRS